jgi:DNA polymerase-3 subunit alpha
MYIPLSNKTTFSIGKGLSKPYQLAHRAWSVGANAVAMTDIHSLAGAIDFQAACKETCKCGRAKKMHPTRGCDKYEAVDIKPILGVSLSFKGHNLIVIARNRDGYYSMIKVLNKSNYNDNVLMTEHLENDSNLIYIFDQTKDLLKDDIGTLLNELKAVISQNLYIGIRRTNSENDSAQSELADYYTSLSLSLNIPRVALNNSYYCSPEDSQDHRIILCVHMKTTLSKAAMKLLDEENADLKDFFSSNSYYLHTESEMKEYYAQEELDNTIKIADLCEKYDITNAPMFPIYDCPDGLNSDEYLRVLCRDGWKRLIQDEIDKDKQQTYVERIKMELDVFTEFKLAPYFLVVQDYIGWAKSQGIIVNYGRGSVGGCLTALLTGITECVDPIKYDLFFERFINKGRLNKTRVSPPDIDTDFPKNRREEVIEYIKAKYGEDKVAQLMTLGTAKGRSAMKDVLNVREACSFDEMNAITKFIPDESKISDDLQEMVEEDGYSSIIMWALENHTNELQQWCYLDEQGELQGDFAPYFEQAIRLEGTKRSYGRHASGFIIAPKPLVELCPMMKLKPKDKDYVVGYEMGPAEASGLIKVDLLSLALLDKFASFKKLLATQES